MHRRTFLQASSGLPLLLAGSTPAFAGATARSGNWYARTLSKIHFDMHTPGRLTNVGRDFKPKEFAAKVKSSGADAICFFARCAYGWSYCPTEVGTPHPHLTRDLFGDGLKACKDAGIGVVAYLAITPVSPVTAKAHPEWCKRKPDGRIHEAREETCFACANTGWIESFLTPHFKELAARYEIDGLFLDGVYQFFNHVCYCEECHRQFGRELPDGPSHPNWRRWIDFETRSVWSRLGKSAEEVKQTRANCPIGINWLSAARHSVPPPKSIGYLTGDPPMNNTTFDTAFHLASWAWRDVPADLMTQRMLTGWQDFTCRTPETIETEFATAIAAGGRIFVGDLLKPVRVVPDAEVMRLLHRCFGFAERRRQLADGARPNSDIAILSSPETLRQPSTGSWRVDEDPLRGAYLALIEDGLTADILFDADTREHLQRYSVLVVPEQAYLTRGAAGAIRDYVRNGGAVVITGCLPMAVDSQEPGTAADKTTFEAIAGLENQGQYDWKLGCMLLRGTEAEAFWRDGDDFRPPLPVPGKSARVAANGAQTLAPLTAPGESFQIGALPPGETLSTPAIAVNGFGKGTVIFCALPLSADIWKRGNPGAKYVLQKMVRRVVRNLTAERLGPASVQMFRSEKDGSTLLHLVSYQPGRRTSRPQAVERPAAVNGVSVRLKDSRKPKRVLIEPSGRPLAALAEAGWLTVSVPEFHIHAVVAFEWV